MKQALKKLKGSVIATDKGIYTLAEPYRENDCEVDQMHFYTNHQSTLAKVCDISYEQSLQRFQQQQSIYSSKAFSQLALCFFSSVLTIRKRNYGIFLFEKIERASSLEELAGQLNTDQLIELCQTMLTFISRLKAQRMMFLNLKPRNIHRKIDGQFCVMNAEFLTQETTYTVLHSNHNYFIETVQKQYQFHSPELLDQYNKSQIDSSTDLFSFGCIIYQLVFKVYPFSSKFAAINLHCIEQDDQLFFTKFTKQIFKRSNERPTAEVLLAVVQHQKKKLPKETKQLNSGSTTQSKSSNIFSNITQMFNKLTTETESWFLSFVEIDQHRPEEKYLHLLLGKLYKKEKMDKLQSIFLKYIKQREEDFEENFYLKTLCLILQLIRKGPQSSNEPWQKIIQGMQESTINKSPSVATLFKQVSRKIELNSQVKHFMKGNYLINDMAKFKLLLIDHISKLIESLNVSLDSVTKRLKTHCQNELQDYVVTIYCDDIHDLISQIIFSVIAIRKDNQLQLRKDELKKLAPLQKQIGGILKQISALSNMVKQHAIYAIQIDYFYYQEEIYLTEKPYYTSLEYFSKRCREYKGLVYPTNYQTIYSSGEIKEYLSNTSEKAPCVKKESIIYDEYSSEGGDRDESMREIMDYKIKQNSQVISSQRRSWDPIYALEAKNNSLTKEADKIAQKNEDNQNKKCKQKLAKLFSESSQNSNGTKNSKKHIKEERQLPKTEINFDDFFNIGNKTSPKATPNAKLIDPKKSQSIIPTFKIQKPKKQIILPKQENSGLDFSFFEEIFCKEDKKPVLTAQNKDCFDNFLGNLSPSILISKPTKQRNQNPNQFNIIDLLDKPTNFSWSNNTPSLTPPTQLLPVVNKLLQDILSGLKLKQLKQTICKNYHIIIEFSKLTLEQVIGSGSAGQVYLGKKQNQTVAIKKVKIKENPNALKQFERELLTYMKIEKHPYIVSLVGLSKFDEDYYLLTEFCNYGSLFDLLHKKAQTVALSWRTKLQIVKEIASGMLALHQMTPPIIHRDLKSLNIFVNEANGVYTSKVADFGLSRSPEAEMMTMCLGTLHWMAPELLDNKQYSLKVDVYSFGIVLWQICARRTPYNELTSPMAIIKHVTISKMRPNLEHLPVDCPKPLIELMKICWAHEQSHRPQFDNVLQILNKIKL